MDENYICSHLKKFLQGMLCKDRGEYKAKVKDDKYWFWYVSEKGKIKSMNKVTKQVAIYLVIDKIKK